MFGTASEQIILQPHSDFRITDAGAANEAVSYLHRDHLASVRLITNAAGVSEQSNCYTPFGDPDTTTLLATATPEEHSFIGERYDASTNRYAYSFNDPVNLSDRNGHCAGVCTGTIGLAIIALLGADHIIDSSDGKVDGSSPLGNPTGMVTGAIVGAIGDVVNSAGQDDDRPVFPTDEQEIIAAGGCGGCEPEDACLDLNESDLPDWHQRPDGIPRNWIVRPAKGRLGKRYTDPRNPHNSVRVMQGNPNSPFSNSQQTYVRLQRNGQAMDRYGNLVSKKFT